MVLYCYVVQDGGSGSGQDEKKNEEKEKAEKEEDEDAVEMTEDVEGDIENVEEKQGSDEDEEENGACVHLCVCLFQRTIMQCLMCTEKEDEAHRMGDLGADQPEELDRNMWAPEENDDDDNKVCLQQ